ncbi:MAG: peptidoglycan-binding protein [Candidatus Pacebacteria bacterium]|nr:peptidoglycan-binding protein [Candidatus Paceibacterota bacterium]
MTAIRTWLVLFTLMFFFNITPPASASEAILSTDDIYSIQFTLFELGYPVVGLPDGKIGPNTRTAIAKFQKNIEHAVTGVLTQEEADYLIELPIPTSMKWGAISASVDAGYGATWNRTSGIDAYNVAQGMCHSKSNYPNKCVTIAGFSNNTGVQWIVAVKCDQETSTTEYDGIAVAAAGSYSEAYDNALKMKTDGGYYSSNCYQLVSIAADGSHE